MSNTTTETTYNFSWSLSPDTDPACQSAYPTGTMDDAIELAATYQARITLTNDAGDIVGWFPANGDWRLA